MSRASLKKMFLSPWPVLALFLCAAGGFICYSLYQDHERIETYERQRLATQAKVIEENLALQLNGIYRALAGIRTRHGDGEPVDRQLSALCDAMPGIHTLFITNGAGTISASSRKELVGNNISNREYFQALRATGTSSVLSVSPPFKTAAGTYVMNLTLMITGPRGEFAGVVSAALDPGYFRSLLSSVLYAPDMWSAIAHGDGRLFLMVPEKPGVTGMDLARPGTFFSRHRDSGRSESIMSGRIYATGEEKLMAQRTIKPAGLPMDRPLVVAVARDISALFAGWRRDAMEKAVQFGALVLVLTSALYVYQRRQRNFEVISARYLTELVEAKESAQRANEAKSRLLVTVAHEFRTPLSLLTSSTDILDRYGERLSREEHAQQHDHIRNAARQMTSLVSSVLAVNRLETPHLQNNPVALDMARFCQNLASEVKIAFSTGQTLRVTVAENCGTVLIDEVLLRRVVENLLTNAFRYTPSNGAVSLHVSREQSLLRIVVMDSGIGIPKESQKEIFEAFFRCGNVEARRGLGLGLSIVQDALECMGGRITVDSAINEGTTMRVEIPLAELHKKEG